MEKLVNLDKREKEERRFLTIEQIHQAEDLLNRAAGIGQMLDFHCDLLTETPGMGADDHTKALQKTIRALLVVLAEIFRVLYGKGDNSLDLLYA